MQINSRGLKSQLQVDGFFFEPYRFVKTAGFGVAVGNAHPEVKRAAALVTRGEHGAGVAEAVGELREKGRIR